MATDPQATHTASVTEVDFRSGQAVRHEDAEEFVPATGRDLQLAARYDDYAWQTAAMEPPQPPRGRWLQYGITAIAVIGFFVMVWFAYQWGLERGYREEVPVIRADAGPVKVKPDNPGGLVVPNQDKLVLNQGAGGPETPGVERLLSAPETPQPVPQTEETQTEASAEAEVAASEPSLRLPSVETTAPSEATGGVSGQSADAPADATTEASAETTAQATAESTPPQDVSPSAGGGTAADASGGESAAPDVGGSGGAAAPAKLQLAAVEDGDFVIQLASVTSDEAAKREWARLRKSFPDLLGDMNLAVQRATVKGTEYHRVQTGPFPSRATALDMCAQLKAQNQPCIVQQR